METSPDLLAFVIHLRARESGELPGTHGGLVHAAFLSLVKGVSSEIADGIHAPYHKYRPFTCSPLILDGGKRSQDESGRRREDPVYTIERGREYWLRFTSLESALTGALAALPEHSPTSLRLGTMNFEIDGFSFRDHVRTGFGSYGGLYSYIQNATTEPFRKMRYHFLSPTAAKSEGRNLLFPLPSLIFPALLARWNCFSSKLKLEEIDPSQLDRQLVVSRYDLKTRMLEFGKRSREIGYTGWCEYMPSSDADEHLLRTVALLGLFSFFSGIGYGTPKGMGQAELHPQ